MNIKKLKGIKNKELNLKSSNLQLTYFVSEIYVRLKASTQTRGLY